MLNIIQFRGICGGEGNEIFMKKGENVKIVKIRGKFLFKKRGGMKSIPAKTK